MPKARSAASLKGEELHGKHKYCFDVSILESGIDNGEAKGDAFDTAAFVSSQAEVAPLQQLHTDLSKLVSTIKADVK